MQQDILELALQGNAAAIADLMNHHLQPKGITVEIRLTDEWMTIIAQSKTPLDVTAIVNSLRARLTSLTGDAEAMEKAVVGGRQSVKRLTGKSLLSHPVD